MTWNYADNGGDVGAVADKLDAGVTVMYSFSKGFTVVKEGGEAVTWNYADNCGVFDAVADKLVTGVTDIYSTGGAFTAVMEGVKL